MNVHFILLHPSSFRLRIPLHSIDIPLRRCRKVSTFWSMLGALSEIESCVREKRSFEGSSFKREREFAELVFSTHPTNGLKIWLSCVLLRGMNWCYFQASASHCQITRAKTFYGSGSKKMLICIADILKKVCPRDTWRSLTREEDTLNKTIHRISKFSVTFKYFQTKHKTICVQTSLRPLQIQCDNLKICWQ